MKGTAGNRRSTPRFSAGGLEAIYLFDDRIKSAKVLDLSLGGVMLRSDSAPPLGASTEITFSNGRRNVIRASARVVDRDRAHQRLRLCFVGLRQHHKDRLRRLIWEFQQERALDLD